MNDRPMPDMRRPGPERHSSDRRATEPVFGAWDPAGPEPQPHASSEKPPGNRRLIITLVVSVGLHAAAVIALLFLLHRAPPALHRAPPAAEGSIEKPTEVELVMEERKGDRHPATAPSAAKPPQPRADPSEAKAATPPDASPDLPKVPADAMPVPPAAAPPVQPATPEPPAQTAAREAKPEAAPAPPATEQAPVISLQGTDSPSNARAFGERVIPAKPDAVFHNRPPLYPDEAAQSGQQGTVVVLIHVSPAGTAAGVDLLRSSGYVLLDRAAQEAVLRWRFLPAVKDGQPVASDMTMGFIFDNLR